jgi:hypothetical protein
VTREGGPLWVQVFHDRSSLFATVTQAGKRTLRQQIFRAAIRCANSDIRLSKKMRFKSALGGKLT